MIRYFSGNHWLRDHFGEPPTSLDRRIGFPTTVLPSKTGDNELGDPTRTIPAPWRRGSPETFAQKECPWKQRTPHAHLGRGKNPTSCLGDPKNADSQSQTWRFAVRLARWLSHYPFLYMHCASFWYTIYIYMCMNIYIYMFIYPYLPIFLGEISVFLGFSPNFPGFFWDRFVPLGSTATVGRP